MLFLQKFKTSSLRSFPQRCHHHQPGGNNVLHGLSLLSCLFCSFDIPKYPSQLETKPRSWEDDWFSIAKRVCCSFPSVKKWCFPQPFSVAKARSEVSGRVKFFALGSTSVPQALPHDLLGNSCGSFSRLETPQLLGDWKPICKCIASEFTWDHAQHIDEYGVKRPSQATRISNVSWSQNLPKMVWRDAKRPPQHSAKTIRIWPRWMIPWKDTPCWMRSERVNLWTSVPKGSNKNKTLQNKIKRYCMCLCIIWRLKHTRKSLFQLDFCADLIHQSTKKILKYLYSIQWSIWFKHWSFNMGSVRITTAPCTKNDIEPTGPKCKSHKIAGILTILTGIFFTSGMNRKNQYIHIYLMSTDFTSEN